MLWRNFLGQEFRKKFQCQVPFCRFLNFLTHTVGLVKGSPHAKNQLDPCDHFNRTPTCDRQTQAQGLSKQRR